MIFYIEKKVFDLCELQQRFVEKAPDLSLLTKYFDLNLMVEKQKSYNLVASRNLEAGILNV